MTTTAMVPRSIALVDKDGRMSEAWYRFMQDIYQFSGLAGASFPLYDGTLVPATQMLPDAVAPPSFVTLIGNISGLVFADAGAQRVHFGIILPWGYTKGTPLTPVIRWSPTSDDPGTVAWRFDYAIAPVGGGFPGSQTVDMDSQSDGIELEDISVLGAEIVDTARKGSSFAMCSICRDTTEPADDYPADAILLAGGFIHQVSAFGTQSKES